MTKARSRVFAHNPFWTILEYGRRNSIGASTASPAGVTHVTSPAHPHAGVASEQWLEFDGNSATHAITITSPNFAESSAYGTGHGSSPNYTPDSTLRWGVVCRFLFRHGKTAGTYDSLPTSDALIARFAELSIGDTHQTVWRVYYTTTGALKVTAQNYTPSAGTEETLGTSAALSTLTNYQIELWSVHLDASGTVLAGSNRNCQLRILSNITSSPPTVTTAVNVLRTWEAQDSVMDPSHTGTQFGEDVARGANFRFYLGNLYLGWENADDPYGTVRMDRLDVNGESAGANMNEWTGASTDVDETGTAVPDDATTAYTVSLPVGSKTQMLTLTAGSYMTGADLPIAVQVSADVVSPAGGKGNVNYIGPVVGDGTNLNPAVDHTGSSTSYFWLTRGGTTNAALGALALSDIAGMEAGVRATRTGAGVDTHAFSTITVLVAYQKDGETATALDPIPGSAVAQTAPGGTLQGMSVGIY